MTRLNNSSSELEKKFIAYCIKNHLDYNIPPVEHFDLTEKQQLWMDSHIKAVCRLDSPESVYAGKLDESIEQMMSEDEGAALDIKGGDYDAFDFAEDF